MTDLNNNETIIEEVTEPTVEETVTEGNGTETIPEEDVTVEDEVIGDDEILPDPVIPDEETTPDEPILEPVQRVHHIHIIAKEKWDNGGRDIMSNSSWGSNPDPENYVLIPDDMVDAIKETCGFCEIELNEEGTEVVSFTANEIPEFETPEPEPSDKERIVALEDEVTNTQMALVEQYETNLALEAQLASAQEELTNTQLALTDVYEQLIALQNA